MPLGLNARSGSRVCRAAATKSSLTLTSRSAAWRPSDRGCAPLSPDVAVPTNATGIGSSTRPKQGGAKRRNRPWRVDQADVALAESHHMIAGFGIPRRCRPVDRRSSASVTKTRSPFPRDLARTAHAPDLVIGIVPRLPDAIRHLPLRWRVDLVRRSLAEVLHAAALLRCSAGGRCRSPAPAARPRSRPGWSAESGALGMRVHALVATILLRGGRMDEVRLDAEELDPPRRQSRRAAGAGRTKRRAIVATDGARQIRLAAKRRAPKTAAIVRSSAARSHLDRSSDCGYRSVSAGRSGFVVAGAEPAFRMLTARSSLAAVTAVTRRPSSAGRRRASPGVINPARWRISPIVEAADQRGYRDYLHAPGPPAACAVPNVGKRRRSRPE